MPGHLDIHLLPADVDPAQLEGSTAVVIDVLRATTVMVEALEAGATLIVPCAEVEEAIRAAKTLGPSVLLGGERRGVRIEQFQLGNSPTEYTATRVGGRPVVVTTTNGTRAILHARSAAQVLIGAFTNLSAVVRSILASRNTQVDLLCAGTDGDVTEEDMLLAGAIASDLSGIGFDGKRTAAEWSLGATALACLNRWRDFCDTVPSRQNVANHVGLAALNGALRETRGGRNLVALGFDDDIAHAAQVDLHTLVPRFHPDLGQVRSR